MIVERECEELKCLLNYKCVPILIDTLCCQHHYSIIIPLLMLMKMLSVDVLFARETIFFLALLCKTVAN